MFNIRTDTKQQTFHEQKGKDGESSMILRSLFPLTASKEKEDPLHLRESELHT